MLTRRGLIKGALAGLAGLLGLRRVAQAEPMSFRGVPLEFGEGKLYQKTLVVIDNMACDDEETTIYYSNSCGVWASRRGKVRPLTFSHVGDPNDWGDGSVVEIIEGRRASGLRELAEHLEAELWGKPWNLK